MPPSSLKGPSSLKDIEPPFSLLRLSAVQRGFGALAISALLWAMVYWALQA
jgi:hypothetical protein